jgi:ATP-binding cassette subfamily C protein LapB
MSSTFVPPPSPPAADPAAARVRVREDLVHPDPLLDCLLEVCRLHGRSASRASLSAGLPLPNGRLNVDTFERAATRAGMSARLQRTDPLRVDPHALPVILLLRDDQACVLLGWDAPAASTAGSAPRARVLLPQTGQGVVHLSLEELLARYIGIAWFVQPHFRFDERTPQVRTTRAGHWFWGAVLAQRFVYRDVLWAAFLINVFGLAFPFFARLVYNRVIPNQALETLWALAIGVLIIICSDLVIRLLRSHFVDEASARIDVRISAELMERVLGMRLENRPQSVGSFASNLRGFEQVRDFIASSTVTALIDLPFALLFMVVIACISIWLLIPVLVVFTIILVMGYVLQHRLHELAELTYQATAQRNATLIESLTGIETIKSQAAEGAMQDRWERTNRFLATLNVRMRALSSTAMYSAVWLQRLASIATIIIGVYLIGQRELSMGGLIACNMLLGSALAPASQIVGLLMQYQGARTALESLEGIMQRPVERPQGTTFIHRRELQGEIEFRNVKFSYPNTKESALNGVSFVIKPGERVALMGKVGSGKTTLQKLIMGLYQPSEGAVLLDGIDLRQLDPADVRRNTSYVSQDVTLFYGSLRDNICLGLPYAEDQAVVSAAEIAGLKEFVNRHPQGFDMQVGERGELLSGGQRQSVGIARAVLHNSPILLLDEPTSAMDFSTEAHLTARLADYAKGKTVVLITHRTSMLSFVDRIIVIDNGKIVADGPRESTLQALASGRIARAA